MNAETAETAETERNAFESERCPRHGGYIEGENETDGKCAMCVNENNAIRNALERGDVPEFDPELYPALYDALNGTCGGGYHFDEAVNERADLDTEEGIREALEALQHDLSL